MPKTRFSSAAKKDVKISRKLLEEDRKRLFALHGENHRLILLQQTSKNKMMGENASRKGRRDPPVNWKLIKRERLQLVQTLLECTDEIVNVFDANRKANEPICDSNCLSFFLGNVCMSHNGRASDD